MNRLPCSICNRPYRRHIEGKRYCVSHLREMGVYKQPRKKLSKEEKESYVYYPRFMWEEKNRYIVKLVKQVMNEMKGESK